MVKRRALWRPLGLCETLREGRGSLRGLTELGAAVSQSGSLSVLRAYLGLGRARGGYFAHWIGAFKIPTGMGLSGAIFLDPLPDK